jgi:hypothetical protein
VVASRPIHPLFYKDIEHLGFDEGSQEGAGLAGRGLQKSLLAKELVGIAVLTPGLDEKLAVVAQQRQKDAEEGILQLPGSPASRLGACQSRILPQSQFTI